MLKLGKMPSGGTRKLCVYFFWGGYAQEEDDGSLSYQGGSRDCVLVSESMSLDDVKGRLMRRVGQGFDEQKLWYTLKFDRKIFLPLDTEDAVEAMFMGNEEHAFVYMGGHGGPLLRKKGVGPEVGNMVMDGGPPLQSNGHEDGPSGGREERAQSVMPNEDASEQVAVGTADGRVGGVGKRSSGERDGERGTGEGAEKRLRLSSPSRDDVMDDGGDLCASEGHSRSSSSEEGSGMDEHASIGSEQPDIHMRKMSLWKKEIVGAGQVFASAEAFRQSMFKYAIAHKFNYKFMRNCRQRIAVQCTASGCPFQICVRGSLHRDLVVVKNFKGEHVHDEGDESEQFKLDNRKLRASMLAQVIEGKIRVSPDYSPHDIMKDLESEFGVKLTYTQSWRARERVRIMVQGKPDDQYKLLPWMCEAICRANPGSTAICELDGYRFKRLFVAYGACVNGFKYCRPLLFLGGTHLNGPCKGVLLGACGMDADNRLLSVAYAIVSSEKNEEWSWFLEKVRDCLGGLRPVIMSERHPEIIAGVEQVFGKENHAYCLRQITESFMKEAGKHGLRKETTRLIVKEMFNKVAYATNTADYDSEMEELRRCKRQLAEWIEANEPERWALSKFPINRWGCMDISVIDDWNKWMHRLRSLPIPCLVTTHLEKHVKKMEKHKSGVEKWKNGVGPKIGELLKEIQGGVGSVVTMQRSTPQVFTLSLTNWKQIVVDLGSMACSCNEWQMKGLPCAHAIVVIQKLNLHLYDYVYNWYKAPAQRMVYNENVCPMKTHDMPGDNNEGGTLVEGGDDLGETCISIMPPNNRRSYEKPPTRKRNRRAPDARALTCSRCQEVGHNRRTCPNVRASNGNVDDISLDELFGSQ